MPPPPALLALRSLTAVPCRPSSPTCAQNTRVYSKMPAPAERGSARPQDGATRPLSLRVSASLRPHADVPIDACLISSFRIGSSYSFLWCERNLPLLQVLPLGLVAERALDPPFLSRPHVTIRLNPLSAFLLSSIMQTGDRWLMP